MCSFVLDSIKPMAANVGGWLKMMSLHPRKRKQIPAIRTWTNIYHDTRQFWQLLSNMLSMTYLFNLEEIQNHHDKLQLHTMFAVKPRFEWKRHRSINSEQWEKWIQSLNFVEFWTAIMSRNQINVCCAKQQIFSFQLFSVRTCNQ